MIPNRHPNPFARLNDLLNAIKKVYASTFYQSAKDYIRVTSYRLEEEKMAVIIQKMVGTAHEHAVLPRFFGRRQVVQFLSFTSPEVVGRDRLARPRVWGRPSSTEEIR